MRFQSSVRFDVSRRRLLTAGLGAALSLSGCTTRGSPTAGNEDTGDGLVRDVLSKQTVYVHEDLPIDVPNWISHTADPNAADVVLTSPSGYERSSLGNTIKTGSWVVLLAANETIDLRSIVDNLDRGGWTGAATPSGQTHLSAVGFSPRTDGGVNTAFVVTPALTTKYVLPAIASILEDADEGRKQPVFADQRISVPATIAGPRTTLVSVVSEEKRLVTRLSPRVDFSNDLALVLEKRLRATGFETVSSLLSETDFDERTQITSMWPKASSSESRVTASIRIEEHDHDVSHEFEADTLWSEMQRDVSVSTGAFVTYEHRRRSIPLSVVNVIESSLFGLGETYRCSWNLSFRGVRSYLNDA